MLFTHRGLSSLDVLQISSHWKSNTPIRINLAPEQDLAVRLSEARARSRKLIFNELAALAERLSRWELLPTDTEGYAEADVRSGGVDTREPLTQTLEAPRQPGLHSLARCWM